MYGRPVRTGTAIYTLSSGTVTPGEEQHGYELNTVVTLTATVDTDSQFVECSSDVISTTNPISITMTRDMTVTATFVQSGYTIYLPLVIRKLPNHCVPFGDHIHFVATNTEQCHFDLSGLTANYVRKYNPFCARKLN
ncbi:MAG: hypothetical protein GY832_15065 [Chloroflexi bacterium]|nr:hypothetical protein [Chloroflexota bacterium]